MAEKSPQRPAALTGPFSAPDISPAQCRFFAKLAHAVSRLNIDPHKADFLCLRLSRRLRALGLKGFDAYVELLRSDPAGPEIRQFIEALTTHTTSFFRERHQYDWLESSGLDLLTEGGAGFDRPLIVWSAACSTGVELWSAAMLLADAAGRAGGPRRYALHGTDISQSILRKAEAATYTEEETAGIAPVHRSRYLMRSRRLHPHLGCRLYRIVPELRERASFTQCNLADPASAPALTADIAFLRNVLIYFEAAVQLEVVQTVVARLRKGGVLLTGHAEAVPANRQLRAIGPSIYVKE